MNTRLSTATLATVVRWTAQDFAAGAVHSGSYDIVTKDLGGTIGVGVYDGDTLIHSFYAQTRHDDYAQTITKDLIADAVDELADTGARFVAQKFPAHFRSFVYDAGHADLAPGMLKDA